MALASYRFRGTIGARWRSYAAIALLLGLTAGLSLFAIAGARRTQSSYPRFLRSARASTLSMTGGALVDQPIEAAAARFPEVVQSRSWVAFQVNVVVDGKADFAQNFEAVGTFDGQYFDQDRFAPTRGRRADPARADEVVVNQHAARQFGYRVGQRLELAHYTPAEAESPTFSVQSPPPRVRQATIVGIGLFPDEVLQDESERSPRLLLTPAYSQAAKDDALYSLQGVRLARGDADVDAVKARYGALVPPGTAIFRTTSVDTFHAQQAVRPQSIALGLFGVIVGVTALLLVGQALTRAVRADAEELAALRALGAVPRALTASVLVGPALAIAGGIVLAVLLAILASPAMPIGRVRAVDPARGINVDLTVLAGGALLMAGLLAATAAGVAAVNLPHRLARRRTARRRSRVVDAGASAGMAPPAVAGLRFALEASNTAVPVRSVMPGAVAAIVALVASIVFAASLRNLVDRPSLYGWGWGATVIDAQGYGNLDLAVARPVLAGDRHVASWSGAYFGSASINGVDVPVLGMDPGAAVVPPITSGRSTSSADEIVLGASTAARLHVRVGDQVRLGSGDGTRLRVVGIATFPTIGILHGAHPSLGVGALLAPSLVPGSDRDITNTKTGPFGPNALFVQLRRGGAVTAELSSLRDALAPAADFAGLAVLPAQRPAEIVNARSAGRAPALLSLALAVGAMVSLGLALGASVRHRSRDLALLKTLGFTRRQLATTVRWQATTTAAVGLLVGVPLGVALGRDLWIRFARGLDVVPAARVPVPAILAVAVAAIVVANVAAAIPARAARRVSPTLARGTAD